jgi:hypothetical protein
MTPVEILKAARGRIDTPDKWTTGAYARTADNKTQNCDSGYACKWCAYGAILLVTEEPTGEYFEAVRMLEDECDGSVVNYNDTHTHAEVLAAFDRAIEALS